MPRHAACYVPVAADNRPKRLPVSIRLDPTSKLPAVADNRPKRLPVSIKLDPAIQQPVVAKIRPKRLPVSIRLAPTAQLPVVAENRPKRLPVSIRLDPTAQLPVVAENRSKPVMRLDPTAVEIIAQVGKLKVDVSELQTEMVKESAARNELNICVQQLKIDAAEAKQYLMNVRNPSVAQKSLHLLMTTVPCKSLEELDWLLAYSVNHSSQWTEYIRLLGGAEFNSAIKTVINTVIDRSVLKQLSWTGLKSKKPSFKFKYKGIINGIHIAMTDQFKDYTIVRGEAKMQSLLRNAARTT